MKTYKITIAYDGTDCVGWIEQPGKRSIIAELERSFEHAFHRPTKLLGASKTDAGVHARGQVARLETDLELPAQKIMQVWNNRLPDAIKILSIEQQDDFHPHHNVLQKSYYYHIAVTHSSPFIARYVTYVPHELDLEKFQTALILFQGTHDFAAFYTGNDRQDTIRTIRSISLSYAKEYDAYRVTIVGEKFLRHMVRRVIGAALAVADKRQLELEVIVNALRMKEMRAELPVAPAQGLMLEQIEYRRK